MFSMGFDIYSVRFRPLAIMMCITLLLMSIEPCSFANESHPDVIASKMTTSIDDGAETQNGPSAENDLCCNCCNSTTHLTFLTNLVRLTDLQPMPSSANLGMETQQIDGIDGTIWHPPQATA
jgi:hypothetical protein